ncbi:Decarboxylase NovR (plasmid) [Streptomyces sp. YIM 121038]|uniref:class II aldolase/adducin family protein n=1 Tax=Streptomyces sp. YIM 121038 TaxID=2136401 RepID=UPI001164BB30|nr:class II aldolase/adducin family protein [Streptomyces sp. YIM 121038]QCX82653.1 Decarboxylase NovR [Streptomyces sp. YIM 121038]QCX82814.1 Decarboxylase NovR [Streptomyces sp. YIM 121038]
MTINKPGEMPPDSFFLHPPAFPNHGEHRTHLKQRLAAAFRHFGRLGFDEGIAGHITVQDPEHTGTFWANPLGVPFLHITPHHLVRVDGDTARTVEGGHVVNIGAFYIHAEIHAARPDVQAVVHLHSTYGRAWSALGEPLAPITQDHCPFFEDHTVFNDYNGIVLDRTEGKRIATALGPRKALILRNHGLLTAAETLDAAAWWFTLMDKACEISLLAHAAGRPVLIPDEAARATRDQIGTHLIGYNSAQPLLTLADETLHDSR